MPEITLEQAHMLDALSSMVKKSSSDMLKNTSSQLEELSTELKSGNASQDKNTKAQQKERAKYSKLIHDNNKHTSRIFDQLKIHSHISEDIRKDIESGIKAQDQLKVLENIHRQFEQNAEISKDALAKIENQLASVGMTLDDIGLVAKTELRKPKLKGEGVHKNIFQPVSEEIETGVVPSFDRLNKKTTELADASRKTADRYDSTTKALDKFKNMLPAVSAAAAVVGGLYISESRKVMEKGLADARDGYFGTTGAIVKLGISTSDYIDILGENRRVQLAMSAAGKDWDKQLQTSTDALKEGGLASSSKEAAIASAAFMKNTSMMGVQQTKLTDAISNQKTIYEKNFRIVGMSLGQFNAFTEDMLNSEAVRSDLAKLDERERQSYVESLQKRQAEVMMMGYSIERAKELNKHFARISDQDPLERITKAAKTRALMGALGMGEQGAELQQLMVKLPTLQGDDRAKAQTRLTEIMRDTQKAIQDKKGESLQSNILYGMLESNLGIKEQLQSFQAESRQGMMLTKEGETHLEAIKRIGEAQAQSKEANLLTKTAVYGVDMLTAISTSSATAVGSIATANVIASGILTQAFIQSGLLKKIAFSAAVGGKGGGMKGAAKGLMGAAKSILPLLKGTAVTAATAYAVKNVMDLYDSSGKTSHIYETTQNLGEYIGKNIAEMVNQQHEETKTSERARNKIREKEAQERKEKEDQLLEATKKVVASIEENNRIAMEGATAAKENVTATIESTDKQLSYQKRVGRGQKATKSVSKGDVSN